MTRFVPRATAASADGTRAAASLRSTTGPITAAVRSSRYTQINPFCAAHVAAAESAPAPIPAATRALRNRSEVTTGNHPSDHGQLRLAVDRSTRVQARSDLAAGDLRLLYLGWLLAVQSDDVDDADTEPPVPAGLGKLSAPLRAVADFLDIDQDLLAAAAQASPDAREDDHDGLATWISCLKAQEKDALLARVAAGEGTTVQALLSRRFRRERGGNEAAAPARTAAELWKAAGDRKAAREKAEEERRRERQAREAAARAAVYTQRLDELATRQEAAWKRPGTLIETKSPRDYDTAVTLLSDLRALAERQGDKAAFTDRFLSLREQHQRKPSLQERFDKAGLPRRA